MTMSHGKKLLIPLKLVNPNSLAVAGNGRFGGEGDGHGPKAVVRGNRRRFAGQVLWSSWVPSPERLLALMGEHDTE